MISEGQESRSLYVKLGFYLSVVFSNCGVRVVSKVIIVEDCQRLRKETNQPLLLWFVGLRWRVRGRFECQFFNFRLQVNHMRIGDPWPGGKGVWPVTQVGGARNLIWQGWRGHCTDVCGIFWFEFVSLCQRSLRFVSWDQQYQFFIWYKSEDRSWHFYFSLSIWKASFACCGTLKITSSYPCSVRTYEILRQLLVIGTFSMLYSSNSRRPSEEHEAFCLSTSLGIKKPTPPNGFCDVSK